MNRSIRKVAVLGSGVMGSAIACHFANVGCQVLLLDIAPKELTPEESAKGLTLESKIVKNRIVPSIVKSFYLEFLLETSPMIFRKLKMLIGSLRSLSKILRSKKVYIPKLKNTASQER
jgi:glycerol-3-phosphate dehydrogenase